MSEAMYIVNHSTCLVCHILEPKSCFFNTTRVDKERRWKQHVNRLFHHEIILPQMNLREPVLTNPMRTIYEGRSFLHFLSYELVLLLKSHSVCALHTSRIRVDKSGFGFSALDSVPDHHKSNAAHIIISSLA